MKQTPKVGDKVIHISERGLRTIRTVGHVSEQSGTFQLREGMSGSYRPYLIATGQGESRWNKGCKVQFATPELLAEVQAEIAQREAAFKAEQERIANDPKTPFNSRFQGGFDDWTKLSLEQLQQIAAWLDAK